MAFIAVVIIFLQTMLYLFNVFSITPLITDLIMKQSYRLALAAPGTPEFAKLLTGLQKDTNIFLVVELIFLLISLIVSFFFLVSTTYASALIHGEKMITIKDLVSTTTRSLKRPFVTCFYVTLFVFGYVSLCLITLAPLVLILGGDRVTSQVAAIVLSVPVAVFYTYLSVVWDLALVVSIVEEKMGIEALGKAAQIVKGMKLQGFILNLLLTILSLILMQCFRLISKIKQPEATQIVISMVAVSLAWMVRMFGDTAYTVFYYRCKKTHGEEVELQAPDVEYTKIPTFAPLVSENMP
ncbi:hypothetical protein DITRI_Ditri07aG0019700 [Diplodiscus trichospermus]